MPRINLTRVLLGGIVAGIVIDVCEGLLNGVLLSNQWAEVMRSLNRAPTPSLKSIIALNVWGLAAGILTVWLYAAIRPRFGAGPRTAICAAMVVWFATFALALSPPVFLHIFPVGVAVTAVGLEIIEMVLAGLAGAYIYKEDSAPSSISAAAAA